MQDFRTLRVWQRAQDLAAQIDAVTSQAGARASGSWRGQVRRSASSIAANVAEGAMRDTPKQFAHFLQIAIGSASETENHIDLAWRTRALPDALATTLVSEVVVIRKMLIALRRRVLDAPSADRPD